MALNVYFKEDPQQIANVAGKLRQQRGSFAGSQSAMTKKATGLRAFWQSDSADSYQKKIAELDTRGQEIIALLDEFVQKLERAGGIYTAGEQSANEAARGLPTSGVYR
ncbi:MAG: WXG100 family type VII secretion target [Gracilibacteraceae bacterium]|jgi:WXG100 family type VII secretion target|nr:WXG100 family type VII secretion target [Gracilibacteraceae bacterium]